MINNYRLGIIMGVSLLLIDLSARQKQNMNVVGSAVLTTVNPNKPHVAQVMDS